MNFDNAQKELLSYFGSNNIFRIFLPLSAVLLIGAPIILIIGSFGIKLGFIATILHILFYLGLILCLSKAQYNLIIVGLALRIIYYIIEIVQSITDPYASFNISALIYILLWGYFAWLAYKKTLKI